MAPLARRSSPRRFTLPAVLVAAVLGLAACNQGGECDECDSDSDCKSGRTCATFQDGYHMCADQDTESCPMP